MRSQQGNLRIVFRLSPMPVRASNEINNLNTRLTNPCLGLNSIIDSISLVLLVSYSRQASTRTEQLYVLSHDRS